MCVCSLAPSATGIIAEPGPIDSLVAVSSDRLLPVCPVDAEVVSLDPRTLGEVAGSPLTLAEKLHLPVR